MKIKTFRAQNYFEPRNNQNINGLSGMEQQINDFIKDKTVIDVKYSQSVDNEAELYTAMVIYDDWISNYSAIVNLSKPDIFIRGMNVIFDFELPKNLDRQATINKARHFLETDFQKWRRYSDYENLLSSPAITVLPQRGSTEPDKRFINHVTYRQLVDIVIKVINSLTEKYGQPILYGRYVKGYPVKTICQQLLITTTPFGNHSQKALIEFANLLYLATAQFGDELVIDLRVMK